MKSLYTAVGDGQSADTVKRVLFILILLRYIQLEHERMYEDN